MTPPGESVLLDLFCGAGGATKGYQRAGFYVIGVDSQPQPRYCGDEFVQADALTFPLDRADAIHASPPCQAYGNLRSLNPAKDYPRLIEPIRERLRAAGVPYVIENVPGAPLLEPVLLCGSMVGLPIRRHRLFECSFPVLRPSCHHGVERPRFPVGLGSPTNAIRKRRGEVVLSKIAFVYGSTRYAGDLADRKAAMDIDWMTNRELTQAIPPAYTELLGYALAQHMGLLNVA